MPKCTLTETEIIMGLRSTEESDRTKTSLCLYKDDNINRSVKGYVQNHGGTWQQAQEVFDYAFLRFDVRVRDGRYPDANLTENNWRKTLAGIGYHAWDYGDYGQINMRSYDEWKDAYDPIEPISEQDYPSKIEYLFNMLDLCGSNCRFIFEKQLEGYDLKEIAELLTQKLGRPISHDNVRTQKTNCMKELGKRI